MPNFCPYCKIVNESFRGARFKINITAPDQLMNVVHFSCKQSSKNQCCSNLCSCRKNGLSCLSACRGCCGIGCYNGIADIEENVSDDDIENYDNLLEKFFSQITEGGPGTLSHLR